jgi:hypothetical protein
MRQMDGVAREELKTLIDPLWGLIRRENNHKDSGETQQHGRPVLPGEDLMSNPRHH